MARSKRRVLGFTGDRDALKYGGGIVLDQGYGPEWWFWDEPSENGNYRVYRTNVPEDVFAYHSWAKPEELAYNTEVEGADMVAMGRGTLQQRVAMLEGIAGYWGGDNLDHDPVTYSRSEMQRKFGPTLRARSAARMNPSRRRASYRGTRSNPSKEEIHKLYREWIEADDKFSKSLQKAYGRRAGDMRYVRSWPGHPEIEAAWKRSFAAGEKYRAAMGKAR